MLVDNFSRECFAENVLSFSRLGKLRYLIITFLVFVGLVGIFSLRSPVLAVSGNLVTVNHSFEAGDLSGWTKTSGWSIQSTIVEAGTKAAVCTYSGTSCGNIKTQAYAITAGNTINFSVWVYTTAGTGSVTLVPNWTVSGSTIYGNPKVSTFAANQWKQLILNEIAPTGATQFQLQVLTSDVNGSYYIDNAVVKDYGQDDFSFQYQDINDNVNSQTGVEGWVTGRDKGYSDWLDSSSAKQKLVRVKVFADNNADSIRQDSSETYLPGDSQIKLEKCSLVHSNVNSLNCTDWSDATIYYGFTDSTGTAIFNVRDDREVRVSLLSPDGSTVLFQVEGVVRDASVFFAIPKSSTLFDFLGILRTVADGTCDSTVGSHPCYKLYTGQSFIWLTGSTLSSYIDHRVSLYADYSQKAASGTYFFPNAQFGGYYWYDLDLNNPVTFGLGGGDINPTSYGANWTELNVKAIHPSAVWSVIEPNAPVNGVHKYFFPPSGDLYTGMSYCGTHGMSCPISITTDETLPAWATMSGTPTVCGDTATNGAKLSTAHIADLRAFAKALAEQYDGDGISDATGSAVTPYLVFQNEPDLQSGCTVADYISQFKEVAAGVHEAGGKISTAGFGLENDAYKNGGDPTHSTTWVEGFLNSTEAGLADYINIHWYQFFKELVANKIGGVWQYWYNWDDYAYGGVRGKLAYVFNILNSNALTINKPIVFGEIGSYQEDDHTANPPNVNNILQARNLFKEFSEAYSTDLRVSQILWFKYVGATGYNPGYGLVVDGYQRLSYTAYKTISAQLTGLRFLQLDHDTNVEGFKFLNATNNVVKEVLWVGKCGTPNNPSSCPSSQVKTFNVAPSSTVTIYGTDGNATNYCDGTGGGCDGTADGLVNVTLNTYFDVSYNPDRNVGIPVIASYTPWGF